MAVFFAALTLTWLTIVQAQYWPYDPYSQYTQPAPPVQPYNSYNMPYYPYPQYYPQQPAYPLYPTYPIYPSQSTGELPPFQNQPLITTPTPKKVQVIASEKEITKPVVPFRNGDVIDYEYIYDELPEADDKKVTIVKINVTNPQMPPLRQVILTTPSPKSDFITLRLTTSTTTSTTSTTTPSTTTARKPWFPAVEPLSAKQEKPVFRPPSWRFNTESNETSAETAKDEEEDNEDELTSTETTTFKPNITSTTWRSFLWG